MGTHLVIGSFVNLLLALLVWLPAALVCRLRRGSVLLVRKGASVMGLLFAATLYAWIVDYKKPMGNMRDYALNLPAFDPVMFALVIGPSALAIAYYLIFSRPALPAQQWTVKGYKSQKDMADAELLRGDS